MSKSKSVSIGRDAVGSVFTTGDGNKIDAKINVSLTKAALPDGNAVDIAKELAQIRAVLQRSGSEHIEKASRALDDADEEAKKLRPNRDEIGKALSRALDYAKTGAGFAEVIGELVPHLTSAVAWLGTNWHPLLSIVGLAV